MISEAAQEDRRGKSWEVEMSVVRWLSERAQWREEGNPPASDMPTIWKLVHQVLEDLSTEFQGEGGIALLSNLRLEVVVHGQAVAGANDSVASMHTDPSRNHATMRLLAPSRHLPTSRTMVDEPKDEVYVHKTLTHELSMLFLWQLTRGKPQGWSFFNSPPWFHDGYEEFLSLMCSSEHTRQVTLPKYRVLSREMLMKKPGRALDQYLDGSLIVEYMHKRFGRSKVVGLLRSERATFGEALHEVTSLNEAGLMDEWREWTLRGPYAPPVTT